MVASYLHVMHRIARKNIYNLLKILIKSPKLNIQTCILCQHILVLSSVTIWHLSKYFKENYLILRNKFYGTYITLWARRHLLIVCLRKIISLSIHCSVNMNHFKLFNQIYGRHISFYLNKHWKCVLAPWDFLAKNIDSFIQNRNHIYISIPENIP